VILHGRRIVWGGRARIRAVLWMGTLVAVQRNPAIRAFYDRLVVARKPKKVRAHRVHAQAAVSGIGCMAG